MGKMSSPQVGDTCRIGPGRSTQKSRGGYAPASAYFSAIGTDPRQEKRAAPWEVARPNQIVVRRLYGASAGLDAGPDPASVREYCETMLGLWRRVLAKG
jgi:hypothetical protein